MSSPAIKSLFGETTRIARTPRIRTMRQFAE